MVKGDASANRAAMPTIAALVDELRAQGLSPRVIYASENGVVVGRKPRNENAFDIPLDFKPGVVV